MAGFMGSGKTTIGRELARRLGWTFVDLDDEIERAAGGRKIAVIFETEGEAAFRALEAEALRNQAALAVSGQARIVALGGGAFIPPANRSALAGKGVSVFLDVPVEALWERVRAEPHRPLARSKERFLALHAERLPVYRLADLTIAADAPPEQVAAAILEKLSG